MHFIPFSNFYSRIFSVFFASSIAYQDVRIENKVHGWIASAQTAYAGCSPGNFVIKPDEHISEPRGWCLLTKISAAMFKGDEVVYACSYTSSGTGYSQFQIVEEGPNRFCVVRVGTDCSC